MGFQLTSNYESGDPYLSNVSLLLQVENGSFVDKSRADRQILTSGNPVVDTNITKFGSGSISLDGSSYLSVPNNRFFDFDQNDFTVECWVYNQGGGNRSLVAKNRANEQFFGAGSWSFQITTTQQLYFSATSDSSSGWGVSLESNGTVPLETWSHVAATRSSSTIRIFINGNLEASSTYSDPIEFNQNNLLVGSFYYHVPPTVNFFPGKFDSVRITNGVSRYNDSFTVTDFPFPLDQY
jgi:hypothetical protein